VLRSTYFYSMREYEVVIYGSYGYTGKLIAEECKAKRLKILLSGRDGAKLKQQSESTGYPFEQTDVNDPLALKQLLGKARLVIHCAGPFQTTAKQMVNACLETGTHYVDITGECAVFELLAGFDALGRQHNILIMPGAGFDVVPSDCLAVHLKNRLPGPSHLQLGFTMSKGGVSRGTARTMIEGLGHGGMIRENGKLVSIALGEKVLEVNFGDFRRKALCIPWGDISTAWRSTGIPNIEVYSGVPESTIRAAKISRLFNWLLQKRWVKNYLRKKIDAKPSGPDEDKLHNGKSYLWGKVWDQKGNVAEARLKTVSGYLLTAKTAVLISQKLLSGEIRPGYSTPAQYFGEGLIFEVEGTSWC
jgi:short subunit dehydrogenase-like uncharacterized protein